jgi:hypothetical protein
MTKFKVIFDSATLHDFTAIAAYRMENFGILKEEAKGYLQDLQKTIREKLETSPMRWPLSRLLPLRQLGLRICFGKNLSPYLAIFKVFPKIQQVLVYHIVWERSDYAVLFTLKSGADKMD